MKTSDKRKSSKTEEAGAALLRPNANVLAANEMSVHVYGKQCFRCRTDARGFATPSNRAPATIVLDATEGFIPLWEKKTTLRWRFQARALNRFANPEAIKSRVRTLMAKALLLWGSAVPIKFAEREDAWDFEVVVNHQDDCDATGCVLASAFFPDAGRHELIVYPKLFGQSEQEQVETMAHEFGHVFGLRHFFANISETRWRSEIFGKHKPFSIMNYGAQSAMTANDRKDLQTLYKLAWSGALTEVNGTPIKLVKPFHLMPN